MGGLDKQSDRYDTSTQELSFDLLDDKGHRMPVVYRGIRPGNFRDAISIVAIGRYQDANRCREALVKCPPYQGAEVEKSYASAPAPGKTS
jgi:cytochrome c-type biogenesis protein CcmE